MSSYIPKLEKSRMIKPSKICLYILLLVAVSNYKSYAFVSKFENQHYTDFLFKKFKDYDSVLLFNTDVYKTDSKKDTLWGIAYKQGKIYTLHGVLKAKKRYKMKLEHLTKSLLLPSQHLEYIDLYDILRLDICKLNDKTDPNSESYITISHGATYSLIVIIPEENLKVVRPSYRIKTYQNKNPNRDREYYMKVISVFEKIFQRTFISN